MSWNHKGVLTLVTLGMLNLAMFQVAVASRFSSTSYTIDASVANSFGGQNSSASYQMESSGGESVIGNGAGGSYKVGMGYIAQLPHSLQLTLQPSGLAADYPLDETTGSLIADQSVNSTYGTLQGTLTSVAGKVGTAIGFDGTSNGVLVGNNTQTQITQGTIEAWVKTSVVSASNMVAVTKENSYWLGVLNGKATVYSWSTGINTSGPTVIADGNWHHLAVTLNSGVANGSTLYVDGAPTNTFTWAPNAQTGALAIGAFYTTSFSQFFNGALDGIKIHNRVLAADELKAEYDAQNVGIAAGLSLGTIIPGVSNTTLADAVVQTDSGGYTLAINESGDLSNGTSTIPAIAGSIATPMAWSEGATKGLGFTLTATNATAIPGSWSSGNNYAAFPLAATTFYTRTGQPTSADYVTLKLRADVSLAQVVTGTPYTNTLTVTGTMTP